MVAISRCLGSLTLLLAGADGARVSRKKAEPTSKFIAGVPVLNYQTAYGGKASMGELDSAKEQDWVVMVKAGTSDAKIRDLCKANKKGCKFAGHPTGGVPFFEMTGTELDLQAVLKSAGGAARYAEAWQGDEPGLFWSTLTEDEEGVGAPFPVEEHVPN